MKSKVFKANLKSVYENEYSKLLFNIQSIYSCSLFLFCFKYTSITYTYIDRTKIG